MFLSQFKINLFGFRAAKGGSNIVGRIAEHGTWEELHDKGNIIATNYYSYKLLLIQITTHIITGVFQSMFHVLSS